MKHEFKNIVAETLLIPLYMRAKESRRDNPILYDKAAEHTPSTMKVDGPGGQSGIRLLPIRWSKAERSGMRGARMVFRPCRAAVY